MKETVGFTNIRGDIDETFFRYGFSEKNSNADYASQKRRIPNTFAGMIFSRHKNQLLDEKLERHFFSNLFFFLPATADRAEDINRFKRNLMLHPFDI